MRTIERSSLFKRDFKKHGDINASLIEILYKLINDEELPEKYHDHSLTGDWFGYRECHVKPDLLLILIIPDYGGHLKSLSEAEINRFSSQFSL